MGPKKKLKINTEYTYFCSNQIGLNFDYNVKMTQRMFLWHAFLLQLIFVS